MARGGLSTDYTLEDGFETYAGDREYLRRGLQPGARIDSNEHAHHLPCGGDERNHVHPQGRLPHTHRHKICGVCK